MVPVYWPINLKSKFLRSEAKGLKDEETLQSAGVEDGGVLYFKDLGIGRGREGEEGGRGREGERELERGGEGGRGAGLQCS